MKTPLAEARLLEPLSRHMHHNFPRLLASQTVGEALEQLRRHPPSGRILYFYVVDADGRLEGVVPTRVLVLSNLEAQLTDVMIRKVITLPPQATVLEACEFFVQHRLLALPVVDEDRHLLGVVDVDLYTEEVRQLDAGVVREDLFQLLGLRLTRARLHSPLAAFRTRFPWLGCNLAAGILAAFLSGMFQDELNRVVALAFFIPVVLNLAESVGSQSVSLALQTLHSQRPTWGWLLRQIRGELATGVLLGLGSGSAVSLVALAWLGRPRVALCLLGGICGGVAAAALLGLTLPVGLRLLRLEPRVAAGPAALAGADVVTILIYLNLARWLLG